MGDAAEDFPLYITLSFGSLLVATVVIFILYMVGLCVKKIVKSLPKCSQSRREMMERSHLKSSELSLVSNDDRDMTGVPVRYCRRSQRADLEAGESLLSLASSGSSYIIPPAYTEAIDMPEVEAFNEITPC